MFGIGKPGISDPKTKNILAGTIKNTASWKIHATDGYPRVYIYSML